MNRRPLRIAIFLTKNLTLQHRDGFEPTTSCLPGIRLLTVPRRLKHPNYNLLDGVKKWRFGRIWKKNEPHIMIFLPHTQINSSGWEK